MLGRMSIAIFHCAPAFAWLKRKPSKDRCVPPANTSIPTPPLCVSEGAAEKLFMSSSLPMHEPRALLQFAASLIPQIDSDRVPSRTAPKAPATKLVAADGPPQ